MYIATLRSDPSVLQIELNGLRIDVVDFDHARYNVRGDLCPIFHFGIPDS